MSPNSIEQNSVPGGKATSTMEPASLDREGSIGSGTGPILSPRQYGGLLMGLSAIGVAIAAITGVQVGVMPALGIMMGTCVLVLLVGMLAGLCDNL
jgi:hypothetical protein